MDDVELTQWLLQNGGPAIRYRTATELVDAPADVAIERLSAELFASPVTQLWLSRVGEPSAGFSGFHHSRPEAFGDAASKLCDLGLRAGMVRLDEKMLPYRRGLTQLIPTEACPGQSGPQAARKAVESLEWRSRRVDPAFAKGMSRRAIRMYQETTGVSSDGNPYDTP